MVHPKTNQPTYQPENQPSQKLEAACRLWGYFVHKIAQKRCLVKSIYYERYEPMVFWEAGKFASILRHHEGNINTAYSNLFQNLLRNENILNISKSNWVASLSVLSSQNSIVPHRSWFMLYTRQHFINQVYIFLYIQAIQNGMKVRLKSFNK